jgi:hypothetical protein
MANPTVAPFIPSPIKCHFAQEIQMMKRLIWVALMSAAFSMACSTNKGATGDNGQTPGSSAASSNQSTPSNSDQSANPNSSASGQEGSAQSGSTGASSSDTSGSSASGNTATSDTGSSKSGMTGSPSSNSSTHKHRRSANQGSTTPQ